MSVVIITRVTHSRPCIQWCSGGERRGTPFPHLLSGHGGTL